MLLGAGVGELEAEDVEEGVEVDAAIEQEAVGLAHDLEGAAGDVLGEGHVHAAGDAAPAYAPIEALVAVEQGAVGGVGGHAAAHHAHDEQVVDHALVEAIEHEREHVGLRLLASWAAIQLANTNRTK